MGYCGSCGGYSSGCPRPGQGECIPAPNPYEEKTVKLFALCVANLCDLSGMNAENLCRLHQGQSPAYGAADFHQVAHALRNAIGVLP